MSEEEKKAKIELLNIPRLSVKRQNARDIILKAINKKDKVIDLMAIQLSDRPLLIFKGNGKLEVLEEPEKVIEYFYRKAEEER